MHELIGVGPTETENLRVSAAVLTRVVFRHPQDGQWILALERKATLINEEGHPSVLVIAQPFGGAFVIRNGEALRDRIGPFRFDSERSRDESDFRLFIPPSNWSGLKTLMINWITTADADLVEIGPERELVEEFQDGLQVRLRPDQFSSRKVGMVIEESPRPTHNPRAAAYPTVRVYSIFEVRITDQSLVQEMIAGSQGTSDNALAASVQQDLAIGGRGRANGIVTLPWEILTHYLEYLPLPERNDPIAFGGHLLAETVAAVIDGLSVPKYKKILL